MLLSLCKSKEMKYFRLLFKVSILRGGHRLRLISLIQMSLTLRKLLERLGIKYQLLILILLKIALRHKGIE